MSDSEKNTHLANMITPYSISVYGNSVGHSNVTENALIALSYHITYKLYEILKVIHLISFLIKKCCSVCSY